MVYFFLCSNFWILGDSYIDNYGKIYCYHIPNLLRIHTKSLKSDTKVCITFHGGVPQSLLLFSIISTPKIFEVPYGRTALRVLEWKLIKEFLFMQQVFTLDPFNLKHGTRFIFPNLTSVWGSYCDHVRNPP